MNNQKNVNQTTAKKDARPYYVCKNHIAELAADKNIGDKFALVAPKSCTVCFFEQCAAMINK